MLTTSLLRSSYFYLLHDWAGQKPFTAYCVPEIHVNEFQRDFNPLRVVIWVKSTDGMARIITLDR